MSSMAPDRSARGTAGSPRARLLRTGWLPALVALVALVALGACQEEGPVTHPRPISVTSPFTYPVALWDSGIEGETVVMVHVTDTGGVDSVYVLEPSGREAFDSAAVSGAYELEFAPGRRGERRVAMWARLPVRFSRSGGEGEIE